ncbi:DNA-binding transcriptional ArsR family regulator [Kitasatospora sp. MAP12-15]|uniref:serine/threonine protein kinase n=1 Tax=unclassified Kitasatospora TaxID=2633591 RepID=UPI0024753AE5|nr:serine/threonine protein kinase [Kitasatospora sp. MAP12-44]MDH6109957.1 DNA-binding transcriptional ArsR family regulator [Kitasatospora sp. MAP12-44]
MTDHPAHTVLIQPPELPGRPRAPLVELGPGQLALFGRAVADGPTGVEIADPAVSRVAGEIRAVDDHWLLSNLSRDTTYVVENPEGGGEYLKLAPRRLGAPVPFEFGRILVPSSDGFVGLNVYAPQHRYADQQHPDGGAACGEPTCRLFALDESAKYFLVLVALCEPRLRDVPRPVVPTASQIAERLRALPHCADLNRSAVNFHLDYLAGHKLRLRPGQGDPVAGTAWKREALAALALRIDLVREEHLALLPSLRRGGPPPASAMPPPP